jgi:hypothetical protein
MCSRLFGVGFPVASLIGFKSAAVPVGTMEVLNASLIKCTLFYISSVPLVRHWLREWERRLSSMPGSAAGIFFV